MKRKRKKLGRGKPYKEPRTTVLIVCEGKTEYLYFDDFRKENKLSTATIKIENTGSDPKKIVEIAKKLQKEERLYGDGFDEIWCVFDRDDHHRIKHAFQQAKDNDFEIAFSNPCFELWYFLHFQKQTASIDRNKLVSRLKIYIKNYQKGMEKIYELLKDKQKQAIDRARKLRKENKAKKKEKENPHTNVDELVKVLNSIDNR